MYSLGLLRSKEDGSWQRHSWVLSQSYLDVKTFPDKQKQPRHQIPPWPLWSKGHSVWNGQCCGDQGCHFEWVWSKRRESLIRLRPSFWPRQTDQWGGLAFSVLHHSLSLFLPSLSFPFLFPFPPPPPHFSSSFLHFLPGTFQFSSLYSWNQLANCQLFSLLGSRQCLTWAECLVTQDNKKYRNTENHRSILETNRLWNCLSGALIGNHFRKVLPFPSAHPAATPSLKFQALHMKWECLQRSSLQVSITFSWKEQRVKSKGTNTTFSGDFN